MKYKDYNDDEVVLYACEGIEDANELILKKYEPYIQSAAKRIYETYKSTRGLELNDLIQEGMLALTNCIVNYKTTNNASFFTYATKCIDSKMISLVVKNGRKKNQALNESLSLEKVIFDYETYLNIFKDDYSPLNRLIEAETKKETYEKMKKVLSDFEMKIFELRLEGLGYKDIAKYLDKEPKTIDNTLQRIKGKLKKIINEQSQD